METNQSTPNRLLAYGSLALGSTTILATQADAATVVDIDNNTYDTSFAGIGVVQHYSVISHGNDKTYTTRGVDITVGVSSPGGDFFRRSTDATQVTVSGSNTRFAYAQTQQGNYTETQTVALNGAQLNSTDNWFYAVDEVDTDQRLWLQFSFGNNDGNFSIVKAVIPEAGETLDNAAAASAVPEPSAMALLALGAGGLLIRRRREAA